MSPRLSALGDAAHVGVAHRDIFHRRVEIMVPVLDPLLRQRITVEILGTMESDNTKAWQLGADGRYTRVETKEGEALVRSQSRFIELSKERVKVAESETRPSKRFHAIPASFTAETSVEKRKKKKRIEGPGGGRRES